MAGLNEVKTEIKVKDIMSSPVIFVFEDNTAESVAKLMDKHDLGSIIVINDIKKPIGIITEKDLVKRIVAKNLLPKNINAKSVMSSPLIIVDSKAEITEAAKIMNIRSIRRLIVMEEGKMIGIISSKDIVAITPALIEIISEKVRINEDISRQRFVSMGYCEHCGIWSDTLFEIEGAFICEECKNDQDET